MDTRSKRRHRVPPIPDLCDSSVDSTISIKTSNSTYSTSPSSQLSGECLRRVPKHAEVKAMQRPLAYNHPPAILPSDSFETYNSVFSDTDSLGSEEDEGTYEDEPPAPRDDDIPPVLPQYRAPIVDPLVRPSTPESFAQLFPSLDRLSIRHDDLTPDGNMNLRVDTSVPIQGRRPVTVQLFHLRMHDLARREFSLRRYCRDSGREVCNSRRAYAQPPPVSRPGFQRSVSSALHSFKTPFRRASFGSSHLYPKRPSTGSSGASSSWDTASIRSMRMRTDSWSSDRPPPPVSSLMPTNSIKLEFSNYARVDVTRRELRASVCYSFEWWGHEYYWKRVFDPNLGIASFHLIRNEHGSPVAHITPEMRSPNQVDTDERSGGWVPPCHLWISDRSLIEAVTDVADVLVATGLIALVDDSIKDRWHVRKPNDGRDHRSISNSPHDGRPRSFMQGFFHRRHSEQQHQQQPRSPPRPSRTVAAY